MTLRGVRAQLPCVRKPFGILICFALGCAEAPRADTRVWKTETSAAAYASQGGADSSFVSGVPSPGLRAAIESIAAQRGVLLRGDSRLGELARLLAADPERTSKPPRRLVELAARNFGIFDPTIEALLVPVTHDANESLTPLLAAALDHQSFTHYGAALVTKDEQRWLAVVLSQRQLELDPVSRSLAPATPIRLRGRLSQGFEHPRVDLQTEGAARTLLTLGRGPDFDVQLPTPRTGLYRVQIVADAQLGTVVLAKLPIYVGIPLPRKLVVSADERGFDRTAMRAQLIAGINRTRARAGLPALVADGRLDAIAQQHSADMSDHAFIGHDSPLSGNAKQRVDRAGLAPGLVLEHIAQAPDASALFAGADHPTGEGRDLLARDITHVGVGIVTLPDARTPTLLVTELFAQLRPPVDMATAMPRLLSLVNEARVRRGTGTLPLDAGLTEVARRAAQSFLSEPSSTEQSVIDATDRELGKFAFAYRRVDALLTVTHTLEDAASLEPVLDPQAGGLGIGVAEGQRAERGNVIAVVMIVGTRR